MAGDLNADGQSELLFPTTAYDRLAAVRHEPIDPRTAWSLGLDGRLRTNVTGVGLPDGRLAVGTGTHDGVRVWQG